MTTTSMVAMNHSYVENFLHYRKEDGQINERLIGTMPNEKHSVLVANPSRVHKTQKFFATCFDLLICVDSHFVSKQSFLWYGNNR